MKFLIVGDSHTGALRHGHRALSDKGVLNSVHDIEVSLLGGGNHLVDPFFKDCGEYIQILVDSDLSRIDRIPFADDPKDWYGISAPFHTLRIWGKPFFWKRYSPFLDGRKKFLVSQGMLRQVILRDQRHVLELIGLLKKKGLNVFVTEAPRPFRHHRVFNVVEPSVISYVDGFYRSTIRGWLRENRVPVVSLPESTYDDDGFMLDRYKSRRSGDQFHANEELGSMMIESVLNFADSLAAEPLEFVGE